MPRSPRLPRSNEKLIYIHGGPGLSSVMEEMVLTPYFSKMGIESAFWNECSDGDFSTQVFHLSHFLKDEIEEKSVRKKVVLLVHSFGLKYVSVLWPYFQNLISGIILLSPVGKLPQAQDLPEEFKTMIRSNDINLFRHYFIKEEHLVTFLHSANFSPKRFFQVMETLVQPEMSKVSVPTLCIFGDKDLVTPKELFLEISHTFLNSRPLIFNESAHYPHLEEPEKFVSEVLKFCLSLGNFESFEEERNHFVT